MTINCITCEASMPDVSEFCPSCGRAVQRAVPSRDAVVAATKVSEANSQDLTPEPETRPAPSVVWNDRLFGAIAYCTFIPAVALLFIKPYAHREFVRFHSLQSVFFWIVVAVLLGIGVLASTFGFLLLWLFAGTLVVLALSLTWLVLSIKALQGEWFRLPGLGQVAEQWVTAR
jgi:uncharacterized membrane protein